MSSTHLDALKALLRSQAHSSSPEIKVALTRLSSDLAARFTQGSSTSYEFFASVLNSLIRIRGIANAELRMACIFDCARYFFNGGYPAAALDATSELSSLANRARNKYWVGKAHTIAGLLHADAGNVAEALPHHVEALSLWRDLNDSDGETISLINLGVAFNYGGMYREAIPCLHRAAVIAATSPALLIRRNIAFSNIAQSYLYLEEFEKALEAIQLSLVDEKEPQDYPSALSRTVREFTFVQIALELGKLDLARKHCADCARYGRWGDNYRCKAMVQIAYGLCEVHGGDVEKGLSLLESSLSISKDLASTTTDALIALVKAYDEASRPERALEYMSQLLNHVRSTREKGVQALILLPANFSVAPRSTDLRALEHREARLRAQVAEREVVNSRIEMLERLAVTAELKEETSGAHGYRVGKLASLLAEGFNWSRDACLAIDLAARLHDIGKIAVPDRILLNSKELQHAERHFMTTHAVIGAELLAKSNIPQLRMAEEIARSHHEWWDGSGYPSKLAGKRIPIHARIVALCDVFDALTHGRPYAEPWAIDRALEEIRMRRGTQFDPDLTDRFLDLVKRLRAEHPDLDAYLGGAGRNSPFLQARNKIRLMLAEEREQVQKATVAGAETVH